MAIKHICFFSSAYPQNGLGGFTFVRELICHIADMGIECSVIAPQSVSKRIVKNIKLRKTKWLDITDKGNVITVYQPRMLTFGYAKVFDFQISTFMTALAIERCYRKNKVNADAIYSHFWPKGIVAGKIAQQDKIPFFVASGESKIIVDGLYQKKTRDKF